MKTATHTTIKGGEWLIKESIPQKLLFLKILPKSKR